MPPLRWTAYIASFADSPLAAHAGLSPSALTTQAEAIVRGLLGTLPLDGYRVEGDLAVHASAVVEPVMSP
jgi:UDP-N-acetylglucosamine diphosphorylase / glucose-1-phosphate thymidylyltransferase / UDP-N-acetylgalactosamine diphosphorylase / glucosamine-1-phosphate N-acetyltransferase / galactosamine-1-phosphate N-acetyltransferase